MKYVPERGDIVWLNFNPQQDSEIKKIRPALVISPRKYNIKTNLAIFIPITSKIKNYPFELKINIDNVVSVILCDQVRSLDWQERKAKKISTISDTLLREAVYKLSLLIN